MAGESLCSQTAREVVRLDMSCREVDEEDKWGKNRKPSGGNGKERELCGFKGGAETCLS